MPRGSLNQNLVVLGRDDFPGSDQANARETIPAVGSRAWLRRPLVPRLTGGPGEVGHYCIECRQISLDLSTLK